MSSSADAPLSPRTQLVLACFEELLETAVADVACECHRIARLGLDRGVDAEEEELRAWASRDHPVAEESGGGGGNKGAVDVFGQVLPAVAADLVDCMNCGRPVAAGRFAPHLEKCMGKGRKARTKTTRSSTAGRTRSNNGSAASSYSLYSNASSANRACLPNGINDGGGSAAEENHSNHILPEP
ncbi:hypothetical protein E2562_018424 [Oryza meyeriana var. granulata]|uniref:SAGA-associated factor 11 n=1 Tax=Oryza meyeriana var. granulata TaxID=110450 RepID=A0A6G1EMB1_9ORYZ|nr:hypothetical protein E2562_018424 [Oryza meyeriana var. granulata]